MSAVLQGLATTPKSRVLRRIDKKSLFGDDYHDVVKDVPPFPPRASQNVFDYKGQNLKERLLYADRTILNTERPLPPIGIRAMRLYGGACGHLLRLEQCAKVSNVEGVEFNEWPEKDLETAKHESRMMLQKFEEEMMCTACMRTARSWEAQMMQEQLLALQRAAFDFRYGYMLTEIYNQLGRESEVKEVNCSPALQREYWINIEEKLQSEKYAYQQIRKGKKTYDQCPTYMDILATCLRTGFYMEDMLRNIHDYVANNEFTHASFIPLITNMLFDDLKKRLYDDFCAILLIIPDVEKTKTTVAMRLLEVIIDYWFDNREQDCHNYYACFASAELREFRNLLRGRQPRDEMSLPRDISTTFVKETLRRIGNAEQENTVVHAVARNLGLEERPPTSQLEVQRYRIEHVTAKWNQLVAMTYTTRSVSDVYSVERRQTIRLTKSLQLRCSAQPRDKPRGPIGMMRLARLNVSARNCLDTTVRHPSPRAVSSADRTPFRSFN